MNTKATVLTFVPVIVVVAIFASYLAMTSASNPPQIYSMPPPNSGTTTSNGWSFTVMTSQGELGLGVTGNLTYFGASNSTYTFGDPLMLCQIVAQNGTIVWSEVTTELLMLRAVTPGQTFSDITQVPTSQLVLGQTYTLLVYPQVNGNGFSGSSVEQKFSFSPLAATQP